MERPPHGTSASGALAHQLLQLAREVADLVAEPGGVLEAEVGGRLPHLLLEGADEPGQLVGGQLGGSVVDAGHERFVVLADPEGNELCLCWD